MGEMFGNIEGSNRYLARVKATVDRLYNNFKKMFGGDVPESKLTTFRDHLEHLIKETKGYNPKAETAKESKAEAKKEAKATTKATDAKLEAELEAELAEETEQTAKPTETKKPPSRTRLLNLFRSFTMRRRRAVNLFCMKRKSVTIRVM